MINYDLCVKLKEHGFPQTYRQSTPSSDFAYRVGNKEELHVFFGLGISNDASSYDTTKEEALKDWIKCPTLSELIEECGHIALFWTGKVWRAATPHSGNGFISGDYFIHDVLGEVGFGQTPEEAVANLYLILNPIR